MAQKPDIFVFDVDGVLLNVDKSFHEVMRIATLEGWEKLLGGICDADGYSGGHHAVMKKHGLFNNDYLIVWTLLTIAAASGDKRLSRAYPTPKKLAELIADAREPIGEWVRAKFGDRVSSNAVFTLCDELYRGLNGREGLYKKEIPKLKRHWKEIPLPVAIYTGRTAAEVKLGLETLGWSDFDFSDVIHSEMGIEKPSPEGIKIACGKYGAKTPVMFGDTSSDRLALQNYGKGYFAGIGKIVADSEYSFGTTEEAVDYFLNM